MRDNWILEQYCAETTIKKMKDPKSLGARLMPNKLLYNLMSNIKAMLCIKEPERTAAGPVDRLPG